jgi:hypothetical protein
MGRQFLAMPQHDHIGALFMAVLQRPDDAERIRRGGEEDEYSVHYYHTTTIT